MSLTEKNFEVLGQFYLGSTPSAEETRQPFLYDSADLTTHAVCVGMTGSGKTGLGIALLEEAAIDGIPALIIDPKGDLTNLALQFPNLAPSDFEPWVSPEAAAKAGVSKAEFAASQAEAWGKGLAKWGESGERIRRLSESAEVTIYTPGSNAGCPVSVIGSLSAPPEALRDDFELFGTYIETTVAGLLGLLGKEASRSREDVFLSLLLQRAWEAGEDLTLGELVRRIQTPPFSQVGVLDVESFFPAKERFQLVLAFNNLLASPNFALWQQGVPLKIQDLLYTPEGKPRLAVFSIAHLGDAERMFFVSILLGEVLAWMRAQPGTSGLRALLYMDEIFGYFPPTANPPSKKPLLTLMKQARAFGLGVVLATQNPVDLDYKGLSNAGTWFIGRLQTERDKQRLLDGLSGIGADRAEIDRMLSSLGKRMFLMNNVHENAPVLFETRWTLSYLAGPLTREQIRTLTRSQNRPAAAAPSLPHPSTAMHREQPVITGVRQLYPKTLSSTSLSAYLIGSINLRYRDPRSKREFTRTSTLATAIPEDALAAPRWDEAITLSPDDLTAEPPQKKEHPALQWGEVPAEAQRVQSYSGWEKGFTNWMIENAEVALYDCPQAGLASEPNETEGEFRARLAPILKDLREKKLSELKEKYAQKLARLQQRLKTSETRAQAAETRAGESRLQTVISAGSALLSLFLGRKKFSATTISRAATTARGVSRNVKHGEDLQSAQAAVEEAQKEIAALEEALQAEMDTLRDQYDALATPIQTRPVKPTRTGSRLEWLALGWLAN